MQVENEFSGYWKLGGSQFLKKNHIPESEYGFSTNFFDFFRYFRKESSFLYSGKVFSICFIGLVQTDFWLLETVLLWECVAILLQLETTVGIKRKLFSKKVWFLLVYNWFPGSWKPFFSSFFRKSFQWNPSLQLVERDVLASWNSFLLLRSSSS